MPNGAARQDTAGPTSAVPFPTVPDGTAPGAIAVGALKSRLIAALADTLRRRGLTQTEAARICRTDQPTFSKVLRGRIAGVSLDKLVGWLEALGEAVRLDVGDAPEADAPDWQALRDSEERYRVLAAASRDGVGLHDSRVIVEVNDALCRMFGYAAREDLVGRNPFEIVAPEAREATRAAVRANASGPYESVGLRRDGSTFPVEFSSHPTRYGGRRLRVSIVRDLSAAKAAEAALRESEARLEAVIRHLPVGVLVGDTPGGRVIRANPEAERIFGHGFTASCWQEYGRFPGFHPDGRRLTASDWPLARAVAQGESVADQDIGIERPDGTRRIVSARAEPILDADGRQVAGVVTFADVTAQRGAERRTHFLLQLAELLRELSDPIAVMRDAAAMLGGFLGVNRANFGEIEPDGAHIRIACDWTEGVASLAGRHALAPFGARVLETLRAGRTLVIEDAAVELRDDPQGQAGHRLIGAAASLTAPVLRQGCWVASLAVHDAAPRRWTPEEVQTVEQAASQVWNATERARAEAALRESEQRLRATYEHTAAGIAETDAEGRFLRVNEAICTITGYGRTELEGRRCFEVNHPEEQEPDRTLYRRLVAGEIGEYALEKRFVRKDGRVHWASLSCSAVRDAAGGFVHGVRVVHDVTERRMAEARQRVLLDELNHRVKNTLATVQSIAAQTALRAPGPAAFREVFEARLMALSHTHDLLTRSNWEGAALRDILAQEVAPYAGAAAEAVAMTGGPVQLGPRAALALGLILHELATNAAKYGALSRPGGHVAVTWRVIRRGAGEILRLDWTESGGPPVTPPTRRGFGTRLVQFGISGELDGEARLDFAPSGLCCTLSFPLSGRPH